MQEVPGHYSGSHLHFDYQFDLVLSNSHKLKTADGLWLSTAGQGISGMVDMASDGLDDEAAAWASAWADHLDMEELRRVAERLEACRARGVEAMDAVMAAAGIAIWCSGSNSSFRCCCP